MIQKATESKNKGLLNQTQTYKYKLNEIFDRCTKGEFQIIKKKMKDNGVTDATLSRVKNVRKGDTYSPTDDVLTTICDVLNTTTHDFKN